MRLAVEASRMMYKLLNNDVVVIEKRPIRVSTGCWLRVRRIGWRSDFLVRGGIKVFPTDELIKIDDKTYHVIAKRKLKYAMIAVIDKMVEPKEIRFEGPLIYRTGYLVFEVTGKEAKLVNAEPTHVMFTFEHSTYLQRAEIVIEPKDTVVFNDWVACRTKSLALAVAFIPFNTSFTVCYNETRHYNRCYEMKAIIPPIQVREFRRDIDNHGSE